MTFAAEEPEQMSSTCVFPAKWAFRFAEKLRQFSAGGPCARHCTTRKRSFPTSGLRLNGSLIMTSVQKPSKLAFSSALLRTTLLCP
jgi:hypothetical protein